MALMDVTPNMTNNTVPSPYVASASSINFTGYEAFRAFDGIVNDTVRGSDCWATAINAQVSWIMLDFNIGVKVSHVDVTSRFTDTTSAPKDFNVLGSNDGTYFTTIKEITGQTNWGANETRTYEMPVSTYRFYKIQILSNNGNTYTSINQIRFKYDTINDDIPSISQKNATYAAAIPMNTTQKILSKTNDYREGLLGMANDGDNYGDLYVIDNTRKARLVNASMKKETIFEGKVSIGNLQLTRPYNTFKSLMFFVTCDGFGYTEYSCVTATVDVSTILENYNNLTGVGQFAFAVSGGGAIEVTFTSKTTIKSIRLVNNSNTISIKKIIGIY